MICPSWLPGRCLLGLLMLFFAWPAQASFSDSGDGTVTDTVNGLMWDQCGWGLGGTTCTGAPSAHTWAQALGVALSANNENYKGHKDWRLPNRNELESQVELTRASPAIDPIAFPNTPAGVGSFLWSSTSLAFLYADAAWVVHFDDGSTNTRDKSNPGYVRLVRGGQPFDFFDAQLSALFIIVPDAFSFAAQTGVALSTAATSSSITVAGINSASPIRIAGGTYSINGGTYTAGAGTVSNGQTVTVRQTASGSYSSTTTATLIIGGVSGAFNVTTGAAPATVTITTAVSPAIGGTASCTPNPASHGVTVTCTATPNAGYNFAGWSGGCSSSFTATGNLSCTASFTLNSTSYTAPSATGSGNITASFTGGGAGCGFATSQFTSASPPNGVALVHGVFSFTTSSCGEGATLNFTLIYPQALPTGTRYYKYGPEFGGSQAPHWYVLPGAVVNGNQITFRITDNGPGDSNPVAGFITDPGGPGVPETSVAAVPVPVPTLSEWGMVLLIGLMTLLGLRALPGRLLKSVQVAVKP